METMGDMNDSDTFENALNDIKKYYDKVLPTPQWSCSGAIEELPSITVCDILFQYPISPELCEKVIKHAEKAPFGRGEKTIIDEHVRKGFQIKCENFEISDNFLPLNSRKGKMMEEIRLALMPESTCIAAKLDKLLIYGKGDVFKMHKDTQRNKHHFGTLLVFLPVEYQGGDFVLKHNDEIVKYSFPWREDLPLTCHWIAFHGDLDHEVEQVLSGYRVTLTYHLFFEKIDQDLKDRSYEYNNYLFKNGMEEMLNSFPYAQKVGIIMNHQYTRSTLSPQFLKGKDLLLYMFLKDEFDIDFARVSVDIEETYRVFKIDIYGSTVEGKEEIDAKLRVEWSPDLQVTEHDSKILFLDSFVKFGSNSKILDGDLLPDNRGNEGVVIELQYITGLFLISLKGKQEREFQV